MNDATNQGNGASAGSDASAPRDDMSAVLAAAQQMLAQMEGLVETAKERLASIQEAQSTAATTLANAQVKASEIADVATAATASKTKINDEQAVIATKSDHIQAAQEHADKVRADLDRLVTAATQQATEAEGLRTRAQTASDSANETLGEIRGHKTTAEGDLAVIVAARDAAKIASIATKELADKAATIEKRIADYEARLAQLDTEATTQLETIVGLLPGATAAGLAHSFDHRRKTFLDPGRRWQWLFIGSLVLLVVLALSGLWNVYSAASPLTYDELGRLWLSRLPIAGALVWLALHASRESALAKRLEEDYGYKAAIAASFQGFQKQMADIGAAAPAGSPLSKLCEDTLTTIATPPGRIYDKHRLTVSPAGELASAAKSVAGDKGAAK